MAHTEHEDFPWTIAIVDHPDRHDSPAFRRSRALMGRIMDEVDDWIFRSVSEQGEEGASPQVGDRESPPRPAYEDHHGGSIWLRDEAGWFFVQQPLGIEWSAQFCADPAKIDKLRINAARLIAGFPLTLPAYEALGYHDAAELLSTPITTAPQVAAWTDSVFNAAMPLPRPAHTGVFPNGAGYHHYPKPIVDIDHFRRDDWKLFVDDGGYPAVVVPTSNRPVSGGRLLAANPDAPHAKLLREALQPTAQVRRQEAPNDDIWERTWQSMRGRQELPDLPADGLPDLAVDHLPGLAPPLPEHQPAAQPRRDPTLLSAVDDLVRQARGLN